MTASNDGAFPQIQTDMPTSARMYDYCLGGKDNFAIDRQAVLTVCKHFPDGLDSARTNRQFLYRLVRFLAREAGIRQFLDMGSGLPSQANVHQVAQQFQPDAHVVYVDNDPVVLAYGRALLADDNSTIVIAADITDPAAILAHPQTSQILDLSLPLAVFFLSIGHSIMEDEVVRSMLSATWEVLPSGSYLAFTQNIALDRQIADESNKLMMDEYGLPWRNRIKADVIGFLEGMQPVEPGLVDVRDWRPDPDQPSLLDVDEPLRPYLGASAKDKRFLEFGGLLRKP